MPSAWGARDGRLDRWYGRFCRPSGARVGKRYTSEPALVDTDNDGLTDAFEVGPKRSFTFLGRTFTWNSVFSDPRVADTDGDGVSDADEVRAGTNPNLKAFDQMMQRLYTFADVAACIGGDDDCNNDDCNNDDFVRTSSDRPAGFDPGRLVFGLPVVDDGPNRVPPPDEIFRTSGWRRDIVDSDGQPDSDDQRSPARHFAG